MTDATFREIASNALRFWEPARLLYNVVLLAIVAGYLVVALPGSVRVLSFDLMSKLFALAVVANVAYCAAYPIDIFIQFTAFRATWLRYRWVLLAIGVLFAAVFTRFIALGLVSDA